VDDAWRMEWNALATVLEAVRGGTGVYPVLTHKWSVFSVKNV